MSGYFDPNEIAANQSGGELSDMQMQPFAGDAGGSPQFPYQSSWGAGPPTVGGFGFSVGVGIVIAVFLTLGVSTAMAIAGGFVPVAIWLLFVAFRAVHHQLAKSHQKRKYTRSQQVYVPKSLHVKRSQDAMFAAPTDVEVTHSFKPWRTRAPIDSPSAARAAVTQRVVEFAQRMIGQPYVSHADKKPASAIGPGIGWDCSSLVQQAWQSVGVTLPRDSLSQYKSQQAAGLLLDNSEAKYLQPGDLMFFAKKVDGVMVVHHVGMFVGMGRFGRAIMIEANHPGGEVCQPPIGPRTESNAEWKTKDTKPEDILYYVGASRPSLAL
jgi:cell wall-associated NlpC family hydrolase